VVGELRVQGLQRPLRFTELKRKLFLQVVDQQLEKVLNYLSTIEMERLDTVIPMVTIRFHQEGNYVGRRQSPPYLLNLVKIKSMESKKPYDIDKLNEWYYQFTTDNQVVYDIKFEFNEDYFPEFDDGCPTCKDIIELAIERSHKVASDDSRIGLTVFAILNNKLSESCNGIIYRCYDGDGKGCAREKMFENWFDEFGDDDKIDKWVNDFSDGGVVGKMYLLVDKGCVNHNQVVSDFSHQCKPCLELQQSSD